MKKLRSFLLALSLIGFISILNAEQLPYESELVQKFNDDNSITPPIHGKNGDQSLLNQSHSLFSEKSTIIGNDYSANDYYYYNGKKVLLHRSSSEFVVKFKKTETGKAVKQLQALPMLSEVVRLVRQDKGRVLLVSKLKEIKMESDVENTILNLRASENVEFAFPVLVDPNTKLKMIISDEIIIKLQQDQTIEAVLRLPEATDLELMHQLPMTEDEYLLRVKDPSATNPLNVANTLVETGSVEWAEPNFIQEYKQFYSPNDPLFPMQWHLWNTGQDGIPPGIDVAAPAAWDYEQGSPDITIAIIDSGVEIGHEDLNANIFTNPGEVPGNGIDDDGNGYIDDIHGWDYVDNDNNPSPAISDPSDGHGNLAAGVAAAVGNNGKGVAGMCLHCKILPVRISGGGNFKDHETLSAAIRYAASFADVLSNSWGGGAPSNSVRSAIQYATTAGRGGKGAVVLFATGNSATGFRPFSIPVPAGTHRFIWQYSKDGSDKSGADTAWLAWVLFPGLQPVSFNSVPSGWVSGGPQPWSPSNDPTHADESLCMTNSAKAGPIGDNQFSWLQVVKTVAAGDLVSFAWVSSETGYDGLVISVDLFDDGSVDRTLPISREPQVNPEISYPAKYPEAIAVGASSNLDCRSSYSQFDPDLDFVAPSSARVFDRTGTILDLLSIASTDQTGSPGLGPRHYVEGLTGTGFGGTSSATPLAAGLAGLILSRVPNMTPAEVRQLMRNTADKIGPEPYVNGRNNRYGYGRINAGKALQALTAQPRQTLAVTRAGTGSGVVTSNPTGINCGGDCGESYPSGTTVTLTAAPAAGSTFAGWSGACSGTGSCQVSMTAARNVTATFSTLSVNAAQTLIAQYYQSILNRAPDAGGLEYWQGEVARLGGLGADIQEAFRVMAGWFFNSAEYLARNTSDTQYVTDLYRTFFNRAPDGGGLSYWTGQLAAGLPRSVLMFSFVFSPEFATYMQGLFGDTASRSEVYAVVDFYRGFLNRLPDSGGFDYWLGRFRAAQCQGAAAVTAEVETISRQFAASAEYTARNRGTRDYVADLYYGFLRRGGDLAGFNYWAHQIDTGAQTRDQVRRSFLQSPEFQGRVRQIISQGCLR